MLCPLSSQVHWDSTTCEQLLTIPRIEFSQASLDPPSATWTLAQHLTWSSFNCWITDLFSATQGSVKYVPRTYPSPKSTGSSPHAASTSRCDQSELQYFWTLMLQPTPRAAAAQGSITCGFGLRSTPDWLPHLDPSRGPTDSWPPLSKFFN